MGTKIKSILPFFECPKCGYHIIYCDCSIDNSVQPDRLNPKDHIRDDAKMVSDSQNSCESMREISEE